VQDLLVELKDQVAALLAQDAAFYICGSSDMAREVRNRLVEIVAESREWSEEEAKRYMMTDMKKARLLQEDVWSN
jgi:sulfite reductase alpha subunit-like flavoprotein